MPVAGVVLTTRSSVVLVIAVVLLLPACHATHNITAILSGRRDLAEFSRALTTTGLADDINGRNTITVLAVDDAHMAKAARNLPREALRHVLSLHVLVDYYDDAKLRRLPGGSTDVSTLFQASGDAPGSAGMVRIAERRGGRVAFAPQDDDDDAPLAAATVFYVKPVHEAPYNISVLQVTGLILSPAAEAPSSSPVPVPRHHRLSVSDVLSKNGCARFAGLVTATADAAATFDKSVKEGFTVFCPADHAVEAFEPTFRKLSAYDRLQVVLYHGMVGYYSMKALEANHEDLATLTSSRDDSGFDCAERHINGTVTLVSASHNAARVTRMLVDADPLAVYMIDAVLLPHALTPAPPELGTPVHSSSADGHQKNGASDSSLRRSPWRRCVAYSLLLLSLS
ncbi:hypothetical protein EJB05_19830, partial [Eragrostis curvula]